MTPIRKSAERVAALILIFLSLALSSADDSETAQKEIKKRTVYAAGALFSARETFFNINLVDRLEKEKNLRVFLPQRDGFQFEKLYAALKKRLPENEIATALQTIIYYLDIGYFIPNSDFIIANLDEPIDEGVVVEICYAKIMGKKVIGLRTDVRSPYGNLSDSLGGMHFFPAYQCDYFLTSFTLGENISAAGDEITAMSDKIAEIINNTDTASSNQNPPVLNSIPHISKIIEGARLLFESVDDIHSPEGLDKVAKRYMKHKDVLKLEPKASATKQ
jgi:nucleoside 2-deoxyribosyltransferase